MSHLANIEALEVTDDNTGKVHTFPRIAGDRFRIASAGFNGNDCLAIHIADDGACTIDYVDADGTADTFYHFEDLAECCEFAFGRWV